MKWFNIVLYSDLLMDCLRVAFAQKPAFDVEHPGVLRLKFICSGQTSAKRKHFLIFWSSCRYHQVVFLVSGLQA